MESKPWYQSKIIVAALTNALIGAMQVIATAYEKGELFDSDNTNPGIMLAIGLAIVAFRKWSTTTVVR